MRMVFLLLTCVCLPWNINTSWQYLNWDSTLLNKLNMLFNVVNFLLASQHTFSIWKSNSKLLSIFIPRSLTSFDIILKLEWYCALVMLNITSDHGRVWTVGLLYIIGITCLFNSCKYFLLVFSNIYCHFQFD